MWWEKPFIRIFFFYAAGILMADLFPVFRQVPVFIYSGVIAGLIVAGFILYYKNDSWNLSWINGLTVGLTILFLGMFATTLKLSETKTSGKVPDGVYIARIIREPVVREKSVKALMSLKFVPGIYDTLVGEAKAVAFIARDSLSEKLRYGDRLLIKTHPVAPAGPANPGEFNYARFLKMNGISYMLFLRPGQWKSLDHDPGNLLFAWAGEARRYLLRTLQANGLNDQQLAVVAAMLLGYDDLMNPEIEQQYVTAGAMHILCVSGLHVGIVYLVIGFLLGFVKSRKFKQYVKPVLILTVIWAYALLTGMSPAVTRASVMFSMFIIADAINRSNDIFNTLAVSAVLMLFFNPLLLFNVSFQLSYSAVLGILVFFRPVYGLLYFRNKLADKIWSLLVVSLAAQLGTFPLAAHYFHYMPAYFWLTNLFVIPISFLIIAVGFGFVMFSWFPFVAHLLGFALSRMVMLLNNLVALVGELPYHGIHDLYFPWPKVFMVYGLIILFFLTLLKRQINYLLPALVLLLVFIGYQTLLKARILNRQKLIVYSVKNHSAYDFIRGDRHVCLMDSILSVDPDKANYQLENFRIASRLEKKQLPIHQSVTDTLTGLFYDGEFGIFNNYRFMVLDGKLKYYPSGRSQQKLEAIIVGGGEYLDLDKLIKIFDFNILILDSSVPVWKRKKLTERANKLGLDYYDVRKQGALVINLEKEKGRMSAWK